MDWWASSNTFWPLLLFFTARCWGNRNLLSSYRKFRNLCIQNDVYIKQNSLVKYRIGEKNLLWIILIFSLSVNSLITFLHMTEESSLRIAKNTCSHKSPEAAQILIDYQISSGGLTMPTNTLQKVALIMIMSFQISEFIIYIHFFIWQHKHNNGNIALLMDPNDVRQRNTTNVITFIGQFYGFLVEGSFIAIFLLLTVISNLNISPTFNNFVRSLAVIAHFVNYGVLSAVEVLTSPSLRSLMWMIMFPMLLNILEKLSKIVTLNSTKNITIYSLKIILGDELIWHAIITKLIITNLWL